MRFYGRLFVAVALVFHCSLPAFGGWREVQELDAALDLKAARNKALQSLASNPQGPEASAIAGWWYGSLDNLSDPDEIFSVAAPSRDPAVKFVLGLIRSELEGTPPLGSISSFELSGPWGVTGVLDILRDNMPGQEHLPPLNTPWAGPGSSYTYWISTESGHIRAPQSLHTDGVVTAAATLETGKPFDGWLVVESRGSSLLELDGAQVDRVHLSGIEAPGVLWYRCRMGAGLHRLRLALAPANEAGARMTLISHDGSAFSANILSGVGDATWAESDLVRQLPPSLATADHHAASSTPPLLQAELARLRGDSKMQRQAIDQALALHPTDPLVHLAAAALFLFEQTASAPEVEYRRTREHLRHCSSLAISPLVERLLAHRQGRNEDVEQLREVLWDLNSEDPRILEAQLSIAVQNRWELEVEDILSNLYTAVGPTEHILTLQQEAYAALNRGAERREILRRLVEECPPRQRRLVALVDVCSTGLAIRMALDLRNRISNPDFDADLVRLFLNADRAPEAKEALAEAFERWGALPALVDLELSLVGDDQEAFARTLERALATRPGDLDLHSLSWHRGASEPFWRPFAVDALEFAATAETSEEGVDAVLLLDQAVERVFADGSSLYYYHGLSKALTPAGARQVSNLEQMAANERLTLRIIKPDGSIVVPADVSQSEGTVVISDVEAGDLVEEEYVAAVAPFSPTTRAHLSPYVYRFADSDRNFGLSEYVLVADESLDIKVDGYFQGLTTSDEQKGALRIRRWRSNDVPAIPNEPFAPPAQELLPWITYGFGVDWQDIGDSLRNRLVVGLTTSEEIKDFAVPRLIDDDPVIALENLVGDLLQRVESGPTLLDLSTTAAASFSRGRGNRLGVLAGALIAAGWTTDLVITRPTPLAGAHLEIPSRDLFGTPVLRVRHNDRNIWIDLREEVAGVNSISPIFQGSDGLVLPVSDLKQPVTIEPQLPTYDNPQLVERSTVEVSVDSGGDAHLALTTWLQDAEATRLVDNLESVPEDRLPVVFSHIANNFVAGASNVDGSILEDGDEVALHLEFDLVGGCELSDSKMTCRALVLHQPLAPVLASLPERTYPLILQLPIKRRFEMVVRPPQGWSIDRVPRRLSTGWGSVEETLTTKGSEVRSVLELSVPAVTVPTEDYAEFSRFCRAIDELVGRPTIMTRNQ